MVDETLPVTQSLENVNKCLTYHINHLWQKKTIIGLLKVRSHK